MNQRRAWPGQTVFICLAGLALGSAARAQSQNAAVSPYGQQTQSTVVSPFGLGYLPQTSSAGSPLSQTGMGLVALPMVMSTQGAASDTANSRAIDPLGLGYVYGP